MLKCLLLNNLRFKDLLFQTKLNVSRLLDFLKRRSRQRLKYSNPRRIMLNKLNYIAEINQIITHEYEITGKTDFIALGAI